MKLPFLTLLAALLLAGCTGPRRMSRTIGREIERSRVLAGALTGFTLQDAASGQTLYDFQGDKYFVPASTTKIFTLYTCLHVLGDSLPGAFVHSDSAARITFVYPTGDPTFLHAKFQAWQPVYSFLKSLPPDHELLIGQFAFLDGGLGPGWAWDDAGEAYSAEITKWPIYGNVRRLYFPKPDSLAVEPAYWQRALQFAAKPVRALAGYAGPAPVAATPENWIAITGSDFPEGFEKSIPVRDAASYLKILLADTLNWNEGRIGGTGTHLRDMPPPLIRLYSTPVDTVYRRMMLQSDNFLAEQLLLVCAGQRTEALDRDSILSWARDSLLSLTLRPPKWVDGSGLSRYNLATPRSLAGVLRKLWREQPRERLFELFPYNGQPNTTLDWFKSDGPPFVFAKTGSMSGVQCMAGYLVAKSGRVLIFSFMVNNFVGPAKPYRLEMQRVLERVRKGL